VTTVQCVILAGGLGTRMARWTTERPKALIPVLGEPFLRLQLRRLAEDGVTDVVVATGYLGEQIKAEVHDHPVDGLRVRCIPDGPDLLGTGGCLRRLVDLGELDSTFLLTYGDSYLSLDHGDVFAAFDASRFDALMTLSAPMAGRDQPNARASAGVVLEYRKQHGDSHLDAVDHGVSVVSADAVLTTIPSGRPSDLAQAFSLWASGGRLQAYPTTHRYYEIGSEVGLAELEEVLSKVEVSR